MFKILGSMGVFAIIFSFIKKTDFKGKPSKHFSYSEFDCKDGTPLPKKYYGSVRRLCKNLEVLRAELGGVPILINSAYRTVSHNKKIGGVPNSRHLLAEAADIRTTHHSSTEIYNTIISLINRGKMDDGGVGVYNTFVHYNYGFRFNRWDKRT